MKFSGWVSENLSFQVYSFKHCFLVENSDQGMGNNLELLSWACCQTSNISCTLVGNKIVDHSHVVGASPVGAAPTTSSFLT